MSAETVRGLAVGVHELTAGYGGSPVVHGISISVEPGRVVSIVGPNGSGKSTLLKAVVGVVEVLDGKVHVGDRDVTGWSPENVARIGVGYVPQVDDVFAPLTVLENLEMGGYLLPQRQVAGRVEHVLEVFPRLRQMLKRRAGKLSGGERKMLAMGRALMLEPSVVILDEPTANLAPAIANAVLAEHVRSLALTGASVLIVEQRAKAVLEISDHTYVLAGGRLRMEGTPAELAASEEFVDSFLGGGGSRAPISRDA
ncbi:MAG TPA: ABC transporter ATP-binding protein [Gaiellaceae bacterium]|nr:ABC transporter ATP-binding protein [Gaiellaceae bacterium]